MTNEQAPMTNDESMNIALVIGICALGIRARRRSPDLAADLAETADRRSPSVGIVVW